MLWITKTAEISKSSNNTQINMASATGQTSKRAMASNDNESNDDGMDEDQSPTGKKWQASEESTSGMSNIIVPEHIEEKQCHLLTTQILANLRAAELEYALLHVGRTNHNFGAGPNMIRQTYNCRPINKQTLTQIRNSHNSTALLNHFGSNAMFIGVHKNHIIRNSLDSLKGGPYINFVKWTKDARVPGAQMVLFNGNHCRTYMQELYEQEFHDYNKALKDLKKKKNVLDQNSIWLACFFNLDALEAASNSSLLLHELTMNQALPLKDDTDMDKLKNVLWLGHGKGLEMAEELIADAIEKWEKSKNSTNTHTAWTVSNKPLFNFLKDIYAHPCFESSLLINISLLYTSWNSYMTAFFITTFRPMLALLGFLVSPVLLPNMEDATMKYLSKSCVISMDSTLPEKKEFLPLIKDQKNAPLIGLLNGSIMNMFDNTFSEHMSVFMTLYGTMEDLEVKCYDNAFNGYHHLPTKHMQEIICKDMLVYYKNNPDGAQERATLLNISTKMMWWKLCFDPSLDTSLSLRTRPPILSVSVIAAIHGAGPWLWADKKLSKRPISFHSTDTTTYTNHLAQEALKQVATLMAQVKHLKKGNKKTKTRKAKVQPKSKELIESEDKESNTQMPSVKGTFMPCILTYMYAKIHKGTAKCKSATFTENVKDPQSMEILLGVGNTSSTCSLDSLSLSLSLEERVPLKQKATDNSLGSCERPTHKRCTFATWDVKNQSSQDPMYSDLPQAPTLSFICSISKSSIPKKRTLLPTYAIANLNHFLEHNANIKRQTLEICLEQDSRREKCRALEVMPSGSSPPTAKRRFWSHSPGLIYGTEISAIQPPPSHWPFPNELMLNILEDMPSRDLRAIAQVLCLSRELAAPLYFRSVGLLFDDDSLRISTQACLALLLYRHSTLFCAPMYVQCNLLDADDCHLQVLLSFVELLGSKLSLFVSIVKDGKPLQ
ncbi:hypothetical protein CY34DRAFT_18783 [Suillus luteus UH-Slu-Lm8-n1]|uniref:Uncharacterized protein n=1 Tax=Suillus luteus UH-Slu-Lm8-n1 TaxID=930992 RepID=A0A0D0A3K1_9AGAM|nr:hypothetical protein CY34DRAFT_18783 [Suillus luteus UH-Slu-Lm8-n1]